MWGLWQDFCLYTRICNGNVSILKFLAPYRCDGGEPEMTTLRWSRR